MGSQPFLSHQGADVTFPAVDWRSTAETVALVEVALEAWWRFCIRARCAREVQLLAEEKDAMQRELSHLRHGRERCKRNALAIIERSMSAAVLARTLESEPTETPMALSELLPI